MTKLDADLRVTDSSATDSMSSSPVACLHTANVTRTAVSDKASRAPNAGRRYEVETARLTRFRGSLPSKGRRVAFSRISRGEREVALDRLMHCMLDTEKGKLCLCLLAGAEVCDFKRKT